MNVLVIHGPNLNLLGTREPEIYGATTLEEIDQAIQETASELGITVEIHQTAREGEIIELLHQGIGSVEGAVLNPGAYTHTSRAIGDAIRAIDYPVVEVHLSNIHAREEWRKESVTGEAAVGVISGLGVRSYLLGLRALFEGAGSDS
jgi:3-dehydroquinate dehydratase II